MSSEPRKHETSPADDFVGIRGKLVMLTTKVVVGVAAASLLSASLLTISMVHRQSNETRTWIQNGLVGKGRILVTNNSVALRGMVQDNAFLAVQELVSSTVREDADVVAGVFMDDRRQPWVSVTPDNPEGIVRQAASEDDSLSLWAHEAREVRWRERDDGGTQLMEFAAPVLADDERLGTIRYTLSAEPMAQALAESKERFWSAIVQFAVVMAAVGVLIYFLGSRSARGQAAAISRPLGELTEAAATIARGDYTTEITTRTNDEVGVLATSFETMRKTVKEYTEKLEERVAERTRELKEAMRELKRSNTELEQFAYVASHDLQEPLRMVSSYMGLLERRYKDKLDDSAREFIGFAVDGAQRMRQLITDLLTYSRVGTKGKPFEETDCGDVYEKATKNLEVAIKEHGARVTHDELPTIAADGSQLVQLFQNLIGNALKFCRDRTPEVHVSARREDGRWVFGVKDNGIGIAPENRERVFQIFQRLHTREEFEGTGIGLSVCKKIVERHGGDIRVESEEGVGTTFWFALPADPDAVTAPDPSPETAEQLVEQS